MSLAVYVGTKSQVMKQSVLGGMAERFIRGPARGKWAPLERKRWVFQGQHTVTGFEDDAPSAVSASFLSSSPAGARPQQVISEHRRNMQE